MAVNSHSFVSRFMESSPFAILHMDVTAIFRMCMVLRNHHGSTLRST